LNRYREEYKYASPPVKLLSLDQVVVYKPPPGVIDDGGDEVPLQPTRQGPALPEGFLGFAINRLQLR